MKRVVLVAAIFLLSITAFTASAQEAITYGQTVNGEITNEVYSIDYTFKGGEGDILVIEMVGVDPFEGFSDPEMVLTDPDGTVLANTEDMFQFFGGYGETYLAVELPATGIYALTATRTDGAEGEGVGLFTLTINSPTPLEAGKPYTGTVSSEGRYDFYVYTGDAKFSIEYTKTDGGYWPEVSVDTIDDEGSLQGQAYLVGDAITSGSIGVFRGGRTYFVFVGQLTSTFLTGEYYFDEEFADYEIQLVVEQ
jgi:hypothetical protein